MSAVFMGMAEMALHNILMEWHLLHMTKIMIHIHITVHLLIEVKAVGGGGVVDMPV